MDDLRTLLFGRRRDSLLLDDRPEELTMSEGQDIDPRASYGLSTAGIIRTYLASTDQL